MGMTPPPSVPESRGRPVAGAVAGPARRTILITCDSLNRHFLDAYGGPLPFRAAERLATQGATFDNHFCGSAPCMPARRELLTGRLELPHRSWGPLEPFDRPIGQRLCAIGCPSMLVTDHYHYFERGGENYQWDFTGYELIRGLENDNWKTFPAKEGARNPLTHTSPNQERNRLTYAAEDDFPVARTFAAAERWAHEMVKAASFFLYIDEFDPHEPFHAPARLLAEEDDSGYDGDRLEWPNYGRWTGTEQELAHIRARYRAKVRFLDERLCCFFDALEECGLWEETTIILTTDHGHYLGDHGWIGKPGCPNYNTLFNNPMWVKPAATVGCPKGERTAALTTATDICATICDLHGVPLENHLYGRSFLPVLTGTAERCREDLMYGYYGGQLGYCDGTHTFLKSPVAAGPLNYCSTRLSAHPGHCHILEAAFAEAAAAGKVEVGPFIPGEEFPVLRFPMTGRSVIQGNPDYGDDALFDHPADQAQESAIDDEALHERYRTRLRAAMERAGFPEEQYERLGLA